ncbi:MAG: DUF2062 domain-containing protein [Gammaproteobacteria bacterium]|nr:DUF2062 domain-containing protein [Gammaproteobacteria bacterium]MDD5470674.1 DUF2062 domain-containing protein [Sideroxydans sp.]
MRKFFRERLPGRDGVLQNRWLQPIRHWLQHPNLWHLNRHSVAGGVALGLFCGLIPGPFQMLAAALLAMWLRVNLPVALATTLYTNPFTIVPLYLLAHRIGLLISGTSTERPPAEFPELHWQDGLEMLWQWLLTLGEPLLIGLPILAIGLSVTGYFVVRFAWRLAVQWKWHQRAKRNAERL